MVDPDSVKLHKCPTMVNGKVENLYICNYQIYWWGGWLPNSQSFEQIEAPLPPGMFNWAGAGLDWRYEGSSEYAHFAAEDINFGAGFIVVFNDFYDLFIGKTLFHREICIPID